MPSRADGSASTTATAKSPPLDFTDWRYIEVDLPGRGIGSANTRSGSTPNLDFPLELTAFHLETATPAAGRNRQLRVEIGPIQVFTQQALSGSLAVQIGYDDPENRWQPALGADVTVQNSALTTPRKVKANWSLLDRANQPIATGQNGLRTSPAGGLKSFRLDLAGTRGRNCKSKAAPSPRPKVTA